MDFIDLKSRYESNKADILKRIEAVLSHGQYIMGPEIQLLEEKLANYVGVSHAITTSSGTDSLIMTLMAYDIGPGDEVIIPPLTFFATGGAVLACGAKIVFSDIDPKTYNLDPALLRQSITDKTKAIMPVSLYGQCANMREITAIASEFNIPVIEDAAQSFGATHHGVRSGALSQIGCTSFFPSKPLGGYGDSGACFTNDESLANILKQIRIHGQDKRYSHKRLGLTGRMDTIQAAVLLKHLALFPEECERRQEVAERYIKLLKDVVRLPYVESMNTSVYAQFTIEVPDRPAFQKNMDSLGIPTAIHYPIALHQQEALKHLGYKEGDFPCAERASRHVISLPMHPFLTSDEQIKIANAVKRSLTEDCSLSSAGA